MGQRILAGIVLSLTAATSNAALLGRLPITPGGTDYQAVYDTDLNITWLADASYAATNSFGLPYCASFPVDGCITTGAHGGSMQWDLGQTWIAAMNTANYLGVSDWRLPGTTQPDASCLSQGSHIGYPLQGSGYNCTGSEMGHLFYNELGGLAGYYISQVHNTNYALFSNIQDNQYWSGTLFDPDTSQAWLFTFGAGFQYHVSLPNDLRVWAVRDGDIAAVPLPAVGWLIGPVLGVLGYVRRKTIA